MLAHRVPSIRELTINAYIKATISVESYLPTSLPAYQLAKGKTWRRRGANVAAA